MADFFTRLAERALGVAPVAAPDLPPMFAPAPPATEVSAQTAAPRQLAGIAADSEQVSVPATRIENTRSRRPAESAREASRRRDELRPPLVAMRAPFDPMKDTVFSFRHPEEIFKPASSARKRSASSFDDAAPIASAAPVLAAQKESAPLSAPFPEAPLVAVMRAEPAPPAIHVTIGRVEVRAVTPAAERARPHERKTPPLLSLDEYLRQRNEGRR